MTGVLPIALGDATRIVQTLLKAGKEYIALMQIHSDVDEDKIRDVFKKFTGKIEQLPPIRSAVKRRLREREIYYLEIIEIDGRAVLFRVGCEAGTYIRKLCSDIGKELGTNAHMAHLIRTKAGPFTDNEMYSLHDLKDAYEFYKKGKIEDIKKIIKPIEHAVMHLPKIWILDSAVDPLCHGSSLYVAGIVKLNDDIKINDVVAIMTLKDELICLGEAVMGSEEIIDKDKGIAVKTKKVFMKINTYPMYKKGL